MHPITQQIKLRQHLLREENEIKKRHRDQRERQNNRTFKHACRALKGSRLASNGRARTALNGGTCMMKGGLRSCRAKMRSPWNQERPSRRIRRCRPVGHETGTIASGAKSRSPFTGQEFISKSKAFTCAPTRAMNSCFGPRQTRRQPSNALTRT